jgi:hypothetical protein
MLKFIDRYNYYEYLKSSDAFLRFTTEPSEYAIVDPSSVMSIAEISLSLSNVPIRLRVFKL